MIRSRQLQLAEDVRELARELEGVVTGEVRFDAGSRAMYAHDASNYRQPPIGVVIPRDVGDVEHTLRVCRARGVPVLGRGGGTSLAGQCVNHAVVIDFSKYLHQVIEIDAARRRVRVEPGCILDDLRRELARVGLTFGPDPATHSHCTLGGMLGNNSCGVHSVMGELYGPGARTSDHVESLEIVTYDGLRLRVGATPEAELARLTREPGRVGEIYRGLVRLRDRHADEIRRRFAPIPRRVSGYNLDELLPEKGFHVGRALVGTESTCVTVLEATLEVYPAPAGRALVVLGFADLERAGEAVPRLRELGPIGLEGMDDRLVEDIKLAHLHDETIGLLPQGRAWLLVELGGGSRAEAVERARALVGAVGGGPGAPSVKLFDREEEEAWIWEIRESGLAATAFVPGQGDAWPGWEDSAVPPDQVGPYLRELRELLDRHGYECSLYGHFGQGCVHTRIDFDLSSPEGIARYRRFTDEAADLVLRRGGSLSGEHGDGQARGELLVKQFGEELVGAFREFKALWDPEGRMNPGKVVDAMRRDEHLKLADYHPPEPALTLHPAADGGDFRHAALRCVGVGRCRRTEGGTMCPSFMVTREEMHTTRGRARMLFEMMHGGVIEDGWASRAVKESLDLCLACKGCKGDCPVDVDIASYKAEFLSHYYRHHLRPRHAYAFGWIHRWALLGSYLPWLANLVTRTPGLRRLAAWIGGITPERPIPRFRGAPFSRRFVPRPGDGPPVILWPDTFNNHFFPEVLEAAAAVLDDAGYRVIVPRRHVCCGRALYDHGMLDLARRLWRRTYRILGEHVEQGTPIVGLEPSCVAAFRDELPGMFPGDEAAQRLSRQTLTLSELLVRRDYQPPRIAARALVHGHCHDKAILDFGAERHLLEQMGLELAVPDSGCCGLAGAFGFEPEHYDISMQIGERVLLPAVRAEPDTTLVIADGFSCREQVRHGAGRDAIHLAELLAAALRLRASRKPVAPQRHQPFIEHADRRVGRRDRERRGGL